MNKLEICLVVSSWMQGTEKFYSGVDAGLNTIKGKFGRQKIHKMEHMATDQMKTWLGNREYVYEPALSVYTSGLLLY